MLNIKILGPGCANCFVLQGLTIATLELLMEERGEALDSGQITLQHLTRQEDFYRYQLLFTPGLVVNEQLVCAGRLPSALEIKQWLEAALTEEQAPAQLT